MIFLFCFLVDTACVPSNCYLRNLRNLVRIHVNLACWQSLYFLFKVRRERVIKCKPQGIYYRQRKGVVVGKEENRHFLSRAARSFLRAQFARELADVF